MPYPYPDSVIHQLWWPTERDATLQIYAILDAARDENIYPTLIDSDSNYHCLYRGRLPQVLAQAAPYLVQLQPQAYFTNWLIREGWRESWGIFLASSATLDDLRRHFRRFIMVKDEAGKALYFRYYDPRVLRVYLPTCHAAELEKVFGPVHCFLVEDEDANTLIKYSCTDATLSLDIVPLR
jgi:Domain of unknown function (DUF4123)